MSRNKSQPDGSAHREAKMKVKENSQFQRGWGLQLAWQAKMMELSQSTQRARLPLEGPQDRALKPKHYSQALKSNGIFPVGAANLFKTVTPLFFPALFRMGMPTLRLLSHHCLVSQVSGQKGILPMEHTLRVHSPTPDLDELTMISDFLS